jgi:hypothetical protein
LTGVTLQRKHNEITSVINKETTLFLTCQSRSIVVFRESQILVVVVQTVACKVWPWQHLFLSSLSRHFSLQI